MSIDWSAIERRVGKKPTYTKAQIAAAVTAIGALEADGDDPNKVAVLWKRSKKLPDISQIDFGDAVQADCNLSTVLASTKRLNRTKLVWHVKHPGQAMRANPFTTEPMTCLMPNGDVIVVDGHHRLAAQKLLGATSYPVWQVPIKP